MKQAIEETSRRREKQQAYNAANGITPETIRKEIGDILGSVYETGYHVTLGKWEYCNFVGKDLKTRIKELEARMRTAAADLEFETAARIRDQIKRLEEQQLGLATEGGVKAYEKQKTKSRRR